MHSSSVSGHVSISVSSSDRVSNDVGVSDSRSGSRVLLVVEEVVVVVIKIVLVIVLVSR